MKPSLGELADELREAIADDDDEEARKAARALYEQSASLTRKLQNDSGSTWKLEGDSKAAWDALDAAVVASEKPGPAGRYARLTIREPEWPGETMTPENTIELIRKRVGDARTRRAAVGVCRAANLAIECVEDLGTCLRSSDVRTRRLAAECLSYPNGYDSENNVGERKLDLEPILDDVLEATGDEDPRVRAGAVVTLLRYAYRDDDGPVAEAMEAVSEALFDEDESVRRRVASRLASHWRTVPTAEDHDAVDPGTTGRVLLGALGTTDLELSPTSTWDFRRELVGEVSAETTYAVESELRRLGWPDSGPAADGGTEERSRQELARRGLTRAVEANPGHVDDPGWYVRRFVDAGGEELTEQEVRILAEFAPLHPGVVEEAVPALRATLDPEDPDEASRQAALALNAVAQERPTAVPVDRSTLLDAYGDVLVDGKSVDADRLVALVGMDERAGVALVGDLCEFARAEAEDLPSYSFDRGFAEGIARVVEDHPSVAREVLDDVFEATPSLDPEKLDRLFQGLRSLGTTDPDSLTPHADRVFEYVGALTPETRSEAARLLRAIGNSRSDELPAEAAPLLADDADPEGDAWPLGTVAAAHPGVAGSAIDDGIEVLTSDRSGPHFAGEKLGNLILEVAEGDENVARERLRRLLDAPGCQKTRATVARARPDLAVPLADEAVERMASASGDACRHRVAVVLKAAAGEDPDAVRSAIDAHYPGGDAFVDDYDPDSDVYGKERDYREIAEAAGFDV